MSCTLLRGKAGVVQGFGGRLDREEPAQDAGHHGESGAEHGEAGGEVIQDNHSTDLYSAQHPEGTWQVLLQSWVESLFSMALLTGGDCQGEEAGGAGGYGRGTVEDSHAAREDQRREDERGRASYCPTPHAMHFQPSCPQSNVIPYRGEQYLPDPFPVTAPNAVKPSCLEVFWHYMTWRAKHASLYNKAIAKGRTPESQTKKMRRASLPRAGVAVAEPPVVMDLMKDFHATDGVGPGRIQSQHHINSFIRTYVGSNASDDVASNIYQALRWGAQGRKGGAAVHRYPSHRGQSCPRHRGTSPRVGERRPAGSGAARGSTQTEENGRGRRQQLGQR